jgi:hypothetical protein
VQNFNSDQDHPSKKKVSTKVEGKKSFIFLQKVKEIKKLSFIMLKLYDNKVFKQKKGMRKLIMLSKWKVFNSKNEFPLSPITALIFHPITNH